MRKYLLAVLFFAALGAAPAPTGHAQKVPKGCEQAYKGERNWEQLAGGGYVYFDYVLCPAGIDPPGPLVMVWLTKDGDAVAVEKWAQGREGAELLNVFHGKKKAYTLYRDLAAVPLKVFKAERRAAVPSLMAGEPFLQEGSSLVPLGNLTPESAARVTKAFGSADALIKQAERKGALIRETESIEAVVAALAVPLKTQQ